MDQDDLEDIEDEYHECFGSDGLEINEFGETREEQVERVVWFLRIWCWVSVIGVVWLSVYGMDHLIDYVNSRFP